MVERAGLKTDIPQDKVIQHTLRHTAISWYLRSGVPPHQVSDYCGVSVQISSSWADTDGSREAGWQFS